MDGVLGTDKVGGSLTIGWALATVSRHAFSDPTPTRAPPEGGQHRSAAATTGNLGGSQALEGVVAFDRIKIDPQKMRGMAVIRDTRVTVAAVLGQLAARRSVEEVLADYPYLQAEDVYQALAFAAAAMQERELPVVEPV